MVPSRSVRPWVCICVVALALGSGCYGKSVLSSGISKWHADLKMNKYGKEAVFVPIFFIVLPFTSLIDYFILNSIDYWRADGDPLALGLEPGREELGVRAVRSEADAEGAPWRMAIGSDRSILEDRSGRSVAELRRMEDGSLVLTDFATGAERRITREEIASRRR